MRILITGAGGLLGGRLCEALAEEHTVSALVRSQPAPAGVGAIRADLTDAVATREALEAAAPDLVVHCAALADAEVCEQDPHLSERENVDATRHIATAARERGARLITVSTDLVFDGTRAFANETDVTTPLTVYGRSKVAAEDAALAADAHAVIFRVALICGRGFGSRRSASEGIATRLGGGDSVTLYDDEWRTPIDPDSIADAVRCVIARPEARGLFHIAGAERVSRYELGVRAADAIGLPTNRIRRASQATHTGAPRPADVSLNIARAREVLDWTPRALDHALRSGRTN